MNNLTWEDVQLCDDGTLDTVVMVNGYEYTYSQDFASGYREDDGSFSTSGWKEFCNVVLANHLMEVGV